MESIFISEKNFQRGMVLFWEEIKTQNFDSS